MDAAIRAAERCGRPVAEVPVDTLAESAGISRSTLLRRIGGSRRALDEAVRNAGVDPGGRPVRERAIEAGARLISDRGLASVTLESVAESAHCSTASLQSIFGTRDRLFAAIYQRYSPLSDLAVLFSDETARIEDTVASFYEVMTVGLTREPRVAPAMLADLLASPHGAAAKVFADYFPQAVVTVGGWLRRQVAAGAIRDIPIPLLMQQLTGPLMAHVLMRPAIGQPDWEMPDPEQVCAAFTSMFLNAVGMQASPDSRERAQNASRTGVSPSRHARSRRG
ncbi:TetR family transcriptional regulator [Mycobacterium sp. 663a-19]|uniref:TetR/AcrR family transcriptional regulator n=1 Tax=Mycobacterium sp. 663a-19 TaxID=2986148 RepID=UPI002D1EEA4C|nr:TetR family transcriptional regulator [Mycobacterium sp. 663a-19]MEB3982479.1 TetR family transcriptional regulator [Mycobacterium sp. 663a-19]